MDGLNLEPSVRRLSTVQFGLSLELRNSVKEFGYLLESSVGLRRRARKLYGMLENHCIHYLFVLEERLKPVTRPQSGQFKPWLTLQSNFKFGRLFLRPKLKHFLAEAIIKHLRNLKFRSARTQSKGRAHRLRCSTGLQTSNFSMQDKACCILIAF